MGFRKFWDILQFAAEEKVGLTQPFHQAHIDRETPTGEMIGTN